MSSIDAAPSGGGGSATSSGKIGAIVGSAAAVADELFCSVCLVRCPDQLGLERHLKGKRHRFQTKTRRQKAAAETGAAAALNTQAKARRSDSARQLKLPSAQNLAVAEQVMAYFSKHIAALDRPECRPLRKAMAPVVEHFVAKKWFGGKAPQLAIAQAQTRRELASKKAQRLFHDQHKVNSTNLRSGRLQALTALIEQGGADGSVPFPVPDGPVDASQAALLADVSGPTRDASARQESSDVGQQHEVQSKDQATASLPSKRKAKVVSDSTSTQPTPLRKHARLEPGEKEQSNNSGESAGSTSASHAEATSDSTSSSIDAASPNLDKPATRLEKPRSCYTCKARFWDLHHFYSDLCPACAALNWRKRNASSDLDGRVFLLTGSRIKIGFQVALKLLRAGAVLLATTRFPNDAILRFAACKDFAKWESRLHIFGLDLRDGGAILKFCSALRELLQPLPLDGSQTVPRLAQQSARLATLVGLGLDGIIHNACQTIRRPQSFYEHLRDVETNPGDHLARVQVAASETMDPGPKSNASHSHSPSHSNEPVSSVPGDEDPKLDTVDLRGHVLVFSAPTSQLQVENAGAHEVGTPKPSTRTAGDAATAISLPTPANPSFPQGHFDVHGQQLDLRRTNSWVQKLGQVHIGEAAECMAINALAPFAINSEFVDLMANDTHLASSASGVPEESNAALRAKFIVNVSAMEGKFYRHKTANHPHTNMAKAALNMMTRTCAADLAKRGVFMTSVDTGWINDENPIEKAAQTAADKNFQTPLDEIDAAARIVDPIFSHVNQPKKPVQGKAHKVPAYGVFLKDYFVTEW